MTYHRYFLLAGSIFQPKKKHAKMSEVITINQFSKVFINSHHHSFFPVGNCEYIVIGHRSIKSDNAGCVESFCLEEFKYLLTYTNVKEEFKHGQAL